MLATLELKLLLAIAAEGGETSTASLAAAVAAPQQAVTRLLKELLREELLVQRTLSSGLRLSLTEKGRRMMVTLQHQLEAATERASGVLQGSVESGKGKGRYHISIPEYKEPLAKLLGAEPFDGTLNLRVKTEDRERFLSQLPCTKVPGFSTPEREYGTLSFYPVAVAGRECGIVIPIEARQRPEIVEIVAPVKLRPLLKLQDGDLLTVKGR